MNCSEAASYLLYRDVCHFHDVIIMLSGLHFPVETSLFCITLFGLVH